MKLVSAINPVWANAEHTQINLDVKFEEHPMVLPFTACPNDVESHGKEIFDRAVAGEFGVVSEFVPPVVDPASTAQPVVQGATTL